MITIKIIIKNEEGTMNRRERTEDFAEYIIGTLCTKENDC